MTEDISVFKNWINLKPPLVFTTPIQISKLPISGSDVRLILTFRGTSGIDHPGVLTGSGPRQGFASKSFDYRTNRNNYTYFSRSRRKMQQNITPLKASLKRWRLLPTVLIYIYTTGVLKGGQESATVW